MLLLDFQHHLRLLEPILRLLQYFHQQVLLWLLQVFQLIFRQVPQIVLNLFVFPQRFQRHLQFLIKQFQDLLLQQLLRHFEQRSKLQRLILLHLLHRVHLQSQQELIQHFQFIRRFLQVILKFLQEFLFHLQGLLFLIQQFQ